MMSHRNETKIIRRDEKGFGFRLSGDNPVRVEFVKPNGAAWRAGVRAGHIIVKVNGEHVLRGTHNEVVKKIRANHDYVALTLSLDGYLLPNSCPSTPSISPPPSLSSKRMEVINELFSTEKTHVEYLVVLDEIFYQPISKEQLLTPEQIGQIFSTHGELLEIHQAIHGEFKAKRKEFQGKINRQLQNPQQYPEFPDLNVGELLVNIFRGTLGRRLEEAASEFCASQATGAEILNKMKKDTKFALFLNEAESHERCKRLDLKSLLATGFQRVTKYPLLLENLLKASESGSKEYECIKDALDRTREILYVMNESKRRAENKQLLQNVQRKMIRQENTPLDLTDKILVHHGILTLRITKTKFFEILAILCTDVLVILTRDGDRLVLKSHTNPLNGSKYFPILTTENLLTRSVAVDRTAFFLVSTSEKCECVYEFAALNAKDKETWTQKIQSISQTSETHHPEHCLIDLTQSDTDLGTLTTIDGEASPTTTAHPRDSSPFREVSSPDSLSDLDTEMASTTNPRTLSSQSDSSKSSLNFENQPDSSQLPENRSQIQSSTESVSLSFSTSEGPSSPPAPLPSSHRSAEDLELGSQEKNASANSSNNVSDRGATNSETDRAPMRTSNVRKGGEKRKSNHVNPSVDEIISGIIQLIGGNVKLSRPPITPRPLVAQHPPMSQNRPVSIPYNPSRINNRGPPNGVSTDGGHNLPPNILIGPGGPVGLPLPSSNFNLLHPNRIPLPHQPSNLQPPSAPVLQMRPIPNAISPLDILPSRPINPAENGLSNEESLSAVYVTRKQVNGNELFDGQPDDHQPVNSGISKASNAGNFSPSKVDQQFPSYRPQSDGQIESNSGSSMPSLSISKSKDTKTVTATITTTTTTTETLTHTDSSHDRDLSLSSSSSSTDPLETSMRNLGEYSQSSNVRSSPYTPSLKNSAASSASSASVNVDESSATGEAVTAWVPFFVNSSAGAGKIVPSSWSEDPPPIITKPEERSTFDITVQHKIGPNVSKASTYTKIAATKMNARFDTTSSRISLAPTSTLRQTQSTTVATSSPSDRSTSEPDIVYGRPANKDLYGHRQSSKPVVVPSFGIDQRIRPNQLSPTKEGFSNNMATRTSPLSTPISIQSASSPPSSSSTSSSSMFGRPIVIPVDVDEVKPAFGGASDGPTPHVITEAGQGSVFIDGKPTYFKIRPNKPSQPTLQVGTGVTVNIAEDRDPHGNVGSGKVKPLPVGALGPVSSKNLLPNRSPVVARRPPFRPRPNTPPVRIDTCIVGDDSTCGVNLNEHCKTEVGISSCQCKPGFGRTTARGICTPISSLVIFLRLDKLGDNKITFNRKLQDPDTEEFQYLEYESLQALNSLFTTSKLGKFFKGVKVNKFYSMAGKMLVNATIELDKTNTTRSMVIKRIVQQEISRVISLRANKLGDSQLSVEESANAIPRVEDINECANQELNDCSKHAVCHNEFGGYRCVCKSGYEDKFMDDVAKSGRFCASCSPAYCSNRGECFTVNGERECRCRGNFIGDKCDIDGEVLGVAIGGSLIALVIIVITFLCLYMWNQRWKREQQKMEAMSAGSGQTFSYVNKAQSMANNRCAIDDRPRWANMVQTLPVNANYNYYVNPDHLMTTSQQHLYATPGRAQTPDALINDDTPDARHYTTANYTSRPARSKSRSSLVPGYQSMGYGPGSVYNETEFSTRETLYSPSHVILPARPKYSPYN
ncbi:uncharacterized protein LOC141857656 [Brevipalpus obovatus]|uniref:uncharacterized protein LOC141857656 n=1 Tax=Brevipalpus obovatus TaxID=246614 RepID=UPI003D9E149A